MPVIVPVMTIAAAMVMRDQDIKARRFFEGFMAISSPVRRVMSYCTQSGWLGKKTRARVFNLELPR